MGKNRLFGHNVGEKLPFYHTKDEIGKMFKAKLNPLIEMDIDMESEWTMKGAGMYAAAIDTTLVCKECGEEWLTVVDRVYMTEYIGGV